MAKGSPPTPAAPKGGKADAKKEGEGDEGKDPYVKNANLKVIGIYFIVLVCPALGLWYRAYVDSVMCEETLKECNDECSKVYAKVNMVFMSEGKGMRACYSQCQSENDICMRTVNVLYGSGGMLCGSFMCSLGLVQLMLFLKSQKKIGSMEDLSARPRPISSEPIFTEDELNADEEKKMEDCSKFISRCTIVCFCCQSALRSMIMLIFQYYGVAPTPDPPWSKKTIKCGNCGMDFEADERWQTNDRSGLKGVCCPRCYRRVLGLL